MRARQLGANDLDEAHQQALVRLPIGRMGTATDIARGTVLLTLDYAAFITSASTAAPRAVMR